MKLQTETNSSIAFDEDFETHSLSKEMSTFDSVCMVVGSVVGSGIFVSPARVFELLYQSPLFSLLAWLVAAFISLAGGLCYSELGCLFPKAGAEYQYLKNGFGKFWGFLFAWTQLMVLGTGSIAIMALVSANYLVGVLFPSYNQADWLSKVTASLLILVLTLINCLGIRSGSSIQNTLTLIKVSGIVFLLVLGLMHWPQLNINALGSLGFLNSSNSTDFLHLCFKFGSAMIACLWAFDGWNNLSRVTEESVNVQKTLPVGLLGGIAIATLLYLGLNALYFTVLSPQEMMSSKTVAISVVQRMSQTSNWIQSFGIVSLIGILISLSAGGACNGSLLSGARIYFAGARDKLFFSAFGQIDSKSKAPVTSLIIQAAWSVGLVWLGKNFETLLDYFSFSAWLFYGACAYILIKLRRGQPHLSRPYKVALYPFTPLLFLLGEGFLVSSQIVNSPIPSLWSLIGVLSGVLVYPLINLSRE